ncbi:CarboxypepD_reg-like domain-containing protein [Ulvibacter litoralis]|uniref:CarboxypepD_reg-like domain-containing protein n=1 Tax=Ulvibacter litoralis TaxID=227084 RepID=A0A1G7GIC3_9FLAO|nr:hypothetical protein GCM10008083_20650 [Ulvibacter litoralis]SDE87887.1 CarboxypepD_reg-like domain-containing protein [Ulvibacter litoralis]
MNRFLIGALCSLFGCFSTLLAQELELQGTVTNTKDVEGIHILNTTSRYNAITNQEGAFSIYANKQDTLFFSSVSYHPTKVVVTDEIIETGTLTVTLKELINELDEVFLGPNLSGNIETDLKNIKTKKLLNFDDVGIPGFKGKPEEKIVPVVPYLGLATAVDLEAMYKHLSGYYKKLRLKRKWEDQNATVANIIHQYGLAFFREAYAIPENRVYDFLLYCIDTSELVNDYKNENFAGVLDVFKTKSKVYVSRLTQTE